MIIGNVSSDGSDRTEGRRGGFSGNRLGLLQAIYNNVEIPLRTRMAAAVAALPFETPKLSATALVPMGEEFAKRLERAIARSREGQRVIEHSAIPAERAAASLSRNDSRST